MQKQEVLRSRESMTIPEILMIQGKLVSQMVAYIWRWADDHKDEKGEYARQLKSIFDRKHIGVVSPPTDLEAEQSSYSLEVLLTVDARKYLLAKEKKDQQQLKGCTKEEKMAADLLINIFGRDRILHLKNYLSPIFKPEAVNMPNNSNDSDVPIYQFHVNPNSFLGTLEDPDMEYRLVFRYMIAYPPSPKLSEATLTTETLEGWIENTDEKVFRPESPFLPVTTS